MYLITNLNRNRKKMKKLTTPHDIYHAMSPLPWRQGVLLSTVQTRSWDDDMRKRAHAEEGLMIFTGFTERDLGRSRQRIAQFNTIDPDRGQADCKAVELAVNNTFGKGINPEVISEILDLVKSYVSIVGEHGENVPASAASVFYKRAMIAIQKSKVK